MKRFTIYLILIGLAITTCLLAEEPVKPFLNKHRSLLKGVPVDGEEDGKEEGFKPSFSVGSIIHMYAGTQQKGFAFGGDPSVADADEWRSDFVVYRGRILVGAQLSEKGNFFMETELSSSISGANDEDGNKSVRITPFILDCQYEHVFNPNFSIIAGLQLVSHNRNGLQGAAALMANDFTYFQYPYNLHPNSPLQGNLGRDLGVNVRGFLLGEKMEYRLGFFSGRTSYTGEDKSQVRTVGRLVYNIFDKDKSFYYSGTNLGKGKTLSIGGGIDAQGTYVSAGGDVFLDMPTGDAGSVTLNAAYSYISGGNDTTKTYSFAKIIPAQNTQYLELGYYLKALKIQPWIRYEKQAVNSKDQQTGGLPVDVFDKYSTTTVLGGGVNYWFNAYNTNLRLSYTTSTTTFMNNTGSEETKTYGQVWLQLQLFIF